MTADDSDTHLHESRASMPQEDSGVDSAMPSGEPAERGEIQRSSVLAEELDAFWNALPRLIEEAKGRFVLIKGSDVIDTFGTRDDAIKEGYDRFGNVPFLVKEIAELERPLNFISHMV